jgi:hypothetical protein
MFDKLRISLRRAADNELATTNLKDVFDSFWVKLTPLIFYLLMYKNSRPLKYSELIADCYFSPFFCIVSKYKRNLKYRILQKRKRLTDDLLLINAALDKLQSL